MQDLKQHIYLPIPSLKDAPQPGSETRDERLKAIIANLEHQHQQVRNNIANAAISHYKASLATRTQDQHASEDERMDVDHPAPAPHGSGSGNGNGMYKDVTFTSIANLSAPHDPRSGDPCLPPGGRIAAPPGVVQVEPPEGMRVAKEVLERIAEYDQQARVGMEFYARALERRGSSSVGNGSGSGNGNGKGWTGVVANASSVANGDGSRNGSGDGPPQVYPDRMRRVENSDPFGRRW